MRSKIDRKLARAGRRKKAISPYGGKALLRLIAFQAERDPALNDELAASLALPKAVLARLRIARKPRRGTKAAASRKAVRRGRGKSSAEAFAAALSKAARARAPVAPQRRRARARRARAAAAAPALVWQSIGPTRIPNGQTYGTNRIDVIGRVSSIAVNPKDPKHILLGAAGGGIWQSEDTGSTWSPRTDQMPSLAIGAIVFDPTNAKIVYAGSGEGNFYARLGAGVYKSSDAGSTWSLAASTPFVGAGFYDLVVDPSNPAILYAATTRGFYKSTNNGSNWRQKKSELCWSISVHPNGGATELLVAFQSGLFVSTNAGNSFTAVALPSSANTWDRLAVDRVQTAPDVAYVFGASGAAAYLWRRSGTTWTKLGLPQINTSQAWYDWYVAATPDSQNQVYLGAIDGWRGDLKGSTWKWVNITTQGNNSIHPDQHCLTFSPNNCKIIYAGSDGGIFRSATSGASWKALNDGLAITEIEYLAGDPTTWKWLIAGTQDNGTLRFTGSPTWDHVADGDGGDCGVNQFNPSVVYHSYYGMSLERSTDKGTTWTGILPPPNVAGGLFYPPVEVFGLTVAMAGGSLVVTRSGTPPWTTVSLGLTANESPTAMRAISSNALVIGTNFGRMMLIAWTGTTWQRSMLTSPAGRSISYIAVDPSNPHRLWVTFSQIGGGLVYRSDDGGATWVDCTRGLPPIPMNSVVVDPANYQRVWVSADVGVYETLDLGKSWAGFSNGLPNAMAVDLHFHRQDRMLVCATRNRGAWVINIP